MILRYTNGDGNRGEVETLAEPSRAEIALRYLVDAYYNEPLLVIRGRDRLAIPAATAYLGLTAALTLTGPVEEGILADVAMLQTWQAEHPERLKYPDR